MLGRCAAGPESSGANKGMDKTEVLQVEEYEGCLDRRPFHQLRTQKVKIDDYPRVHCTLHAHT